MYNNIYIYNFHLTSMFNITFLPTVLYRTEPAKWWMPKACWVCDFI